MQNVYCLVRNCGYCGKNGFCLNRLTVINDQGVCKYLTKPGWDQPIDEKWYNIYTPSETIEEKVLEGKTESTQSL